VSYKTREKKRQAKVRAQGMIKGARQTHSVETSTRYYLIHAGRECRCAARGCLIRKGQEMVYRKSGPVSLCLLCADKDPLVDWRPSAAWEARRMGKNPGRARAQATRRRGQEVGHG
jgi:hypothetical protein